MHIEYLFVKDYKFTLGPSLTASASVSEESYKACRNEKFQE